MVKIIIKVNKIMVYRRLVDVGLKEMAEDLLATAENI